MYHTGDRKAEWFFNEYRRKQREGSWPTVNDYKRRQLDYPPRYYP